VKKLFPVMACTWLLVSAPARAIDPFSRELDSVEAGNQSYGEQHFDRALDLYEQAEQEVAQEPRVHFNRGAALFKLGRPKEAREAYLRASGIEDPGMKKQNYFNIGNTFLAEGAFQDAIPYYRRALEIDPGFDDARFNLELALQAIRQQQQQQQQQGQSGQQDQKEGQDQKKQDQQKDQQKEGPEDKGKQDEKEKQDKQDKQQGDQQDQQKQDQQKQDQQKQEGQEDKKEQPGEQGKEQEKEQEKKQEKEKEQQAQQQEGQQGDEQEQEKSEQKQPGQPRPRPEKIPGQLSQAEFKDLLDSMRDSEKPFQMHKFVLPEYRQKQVEKDW
jgi:Ca-activated chloride channel family protein